MLAGRAREKPDLKSPCRGFFSPESLPRAPPGHRAPGSGVAGRGGRCPGRGAVCGARVARNSTAGTGVCGDGARWTGAFGHAASFAYICIYIFINIHTYSASSNADSGVVVWPRGLVCFLGLNYLYSYLFVYFLDVPCAIT